MTEAETARRLRLQKQRIDYDRERQIKAMAYRQESDRLRRHIRAMGQEPCA